MGGQQVQRASLHSQFYKTRQLSGHTRPRSFQTDETQYSSNGRSAEQESAICVRRGFAFRDEGDAG